MDAAIAAMKAGHNQYAPMPGVPALRQAIAEHQRHFYGLEHDPDTEVTVHAGATGALCATLQALLDPGDEAIIFEPYYDAYRPGISLAGATERVVRLTPPGFTFDPAELEAAVGPEDAPAPLELAQQPRGQGLLPRRARGDRRRLRPPRSPRGHRRGLRAHRLRGRAHPPGDAARACASGRSPSRPRARPSASPAGRSAGPARPPPLAAAVRAAHQFITYAVATPFQHAMAAALQAADDYYDDLREGYRARRDHLCAGLADIGFLVQPPVGHLLRQRRHPPPGLRATTWTSAGPFRSVSVSPPSP